MQTKKRTRWKPVMVCVAASLAAGVAVCWAQQKGAPAFPNAGSLQQLQQAAIDQQKAFQTSAAASAASNPRQTGSNSPFSVNPGYQTGSYFQESIRTKRNDERQKRLEGDTQRLLALANQLKSEVAASGAESMTPEMLHQMDEIEKLAKSVKDRMRN